MRLASLIRLFAPSVGGRKRLVRDPSMVPVRDLGVPSFEHSAQLVDLWWECLVDHQLGEFGHYIDSGGVIVDLVDIPDRFFRPVGPFNLTMRITSRKTCSEPCRCGVVESFGSHGE